MARRASHSIFWVGLLQLAVAACSTPDRIAAVPPALTLKAATVLGPRIRYFVAEDTSAFHAEAVDALAKERAWRRARGMGDDLPPASYLAISGGGDDGAFAAGFLTGWSAAGSRPEFKAVTGVSTGALIAPFAFLGRHYDVVLEQVFTGISGKQVFHRRGLVKGLLSDALADSAPLAKLIATYVDRPFLDAIAREYAKGRLLLVGTTDLDALEPVVWNMTAIAASSDPRAVELFRQVLLASASIPGVVPPVMLEVEVNGVRFQEMHVDGGAMSQVFLYPPSVSLGDRVQRERRLFILRNARLDAAWEEVPRKTTAIAVRALNSLTAAQGVGDLYRIYTTAHREGVKFNLASVPKSFNEPRREPFDTRYMRALFVVGRQLARAGYEWQKFPPGIENPEKAGSSGN